MKLNMKRISFAVAAMALSSAALAKDFVPA
jgi:hypothetical protein